MLLLSARVLIPIAALVVAVGACGGGGGAETAEDGGGPADGAPDDAGSGDADADANAGSDADADADADQTSGDAAADADDGSVEPQCDFFSSPEGGGAGADGSEARPWGSLEALAAGGSLPTSGTLCLMDGHHGRPRLGSLAADPDLTIRALHRHQAVVGALSLTAVSHLTLDGVMVDGQSIIDAGADERQSFLVTGDADTHWVTLNDVLVRSAESCATWGWDDWIYRVRSGIDFRGTDITIRDTEIRNTYHALLLRGDRAWVEGTLIDNFGGDGIRGLGSDSSYVWNTVRDAYIDEYDVQHDDAFQAYKLGGDLRIANVNISHNRFILFAILTDFVVDNGLVGTLMQGVIITDGYADGWVVENNLIVNGQQHGISLFGGRNCRVQNNTVVAHPDFVPTSGPWLRISDQTKTGHPNFDNVIRNNLAQMLTPWDYDVTSLVEANLEIGVAADHLVDAGGLDFHLVSGSAAVNAGVNTDLVIEDLDGLPRLAGDAVDLGAFERH